IAAGPAEAVNQAGLYRIPADPEDDRDNRGRRLRRKSRGLAPGRHDDGDLPANQIGGERRQAAIVAACPAELDRYVFTLGEATLLQPATKRFEPVYGILRRARAQEADHRQRRLLRARRERPRDGRATEHRDELAALHSITSSARASSIGGTSRPSALAVLRLISNSSFVD